MEGREGIGTGGVGDLGHERSVGLPVAYGLSVRLVSMLDDGIRTGLVEGDEIVDLTDPAIGLPGDMVALLTLGPEAADPLRRAATTGARRLSMASTLLLAPVVAARRRGSAASGPNVSRATISPGSPMAGSVRSTISSPSTRPVRTRSSSMLTSRTDRPYATGSPTLLSCPRSPTPPVPIPSRPSMVRWR